MGLPTPPGEAAKGMQCTPTQTRSQPENGQPQHQGPGPCTQREEAWNSLEHKELRSETNSVTLLPRCYPEHLLAPQSPTCSTCQVSNSNPVIFIYLWFSSLRFPSNYVLLYLQLLHIRTHHISLPHVSSLFSCL